MRKSLKETQTVFCQFGLELFLPLYYVDVNNRLQQTYFSVFVFPCICYVLILLLFSLRAEFNTSAL